MQIKNDFFKKMKKIIGGILISLGLLSCSKNWVKTSVETEKNLRITTEIPEDAQISALVLPYKKELQNKMNEKISYTDIELTKEGAGGGYLGNLLADYTFESASQWAKNHQIPNVDACVLNIGGIRSVIPKGDILLHHIYEVMPFENELVIVEMEGKDMTELFNYYLENKKNNPVSKIFIQTEKGKILKSLIGNQPIKNNKKYYIATSDYLALGGDNMIFFSKGKIINTEKKLRDVFIEKFKENKKVKISSEKRLLLD